MKKWLLAVLPATALAAPPQGFYQNYQDWDIACDNTGTCRLAGYQADETETPVSILFTRKAGANAAVVGEVSLLPFNDDDRQLARVQRIDAERQITGQIGVEQKRHRQIEQRANQRLARSIEKRK